MVSDIAISEPRVFGEVLQISVASAIPLELLLSSDTAKPYTHLYLNLRTLYRNFHGSFHRETIPPINEFTQTFIDEVKTILGLVSESVSGNIQPFLYFASAKSLGRAMPNAKLAQSITAKQISYDAMERKVVDRALVVLQKENIAIGMFDVSIKGYNSSSLLMTHMPVDLVACTGFRKLVLLESHTGALKPRTEWITKITKNANYRNIPFNILTIQILGDHNNQLGSLGKAFTGTLVKLAETYKWNATTTIERVRFDIRKMADKYTSSVFLEMSNVKLP